VKLIKIEKMIEFCSKKRMVVAIAALAGLSVLIIILESTHLRSHQDDIHDRKQRKSAL